MNKSIYVTNYANGIHPADREPLPLPRWENDDTETEGPTAMNNLAVANSLNQCGCGCGGDETPLLPAHMNGGW